ncbi:Exosome complex component RRP45B [Chlorella vulgaris]
MAALQRDADSSISNNEREFILKALKEGQRIDGRTPFELRTLRLQFALDDSSCTVLLGRTRVMAVVTASLEAPFADRHNEGSLRFNVEYSPMASPAFEPGRPGEAAIEVARLVERGLRESRAVDLEALVVLAGRKVWHLRVDVHVLDHQGALVDACGLAALAALMAFRRPDVTVGGDDGQTVIVHPRELREPVPLSLHHLPLPITFAAFEGGDLLAVDPSLKEEAAAAGSFTVVQNAFGELCALQKIDGCGLTPPQLLRCIRLATQKVEERTGEIRRALAAHDVARVQARVRRHPGLKAPAPSTAANGRGVTVLCSDQLLPQSGGGVSAGKPGSGGGSSAALDLDALPDSVRSILQQAAAAEGESSEGEESSSEEEEEAGSSEQEEEEEEAEQVGQDMEVEAAPQDSAPAAAQQQQQQDGLQPASRQAAAAATSLLPAQQGSAGQQQKKRRAAPGSASKEQQRDELAAIADLIASAGGSTAAAAAGGGAADLGAAVKKKNKKGRGA